MSTSTLRTHAPSPSYVPRTTTLPASASLPPRPQVGHGHVRSSSTSRIDAKAAQAHGSSRLSSPAFAGPSYTSRPAAAERSGSSLKNEVKGEIDQGAKAILRLFSTLPAPLPESLPPTFLPTPSASPSSSTSSPPRTFAEFVRASSKPLSKRKRTKSDSDSDVSSTEGQAGSSHRVGLGLGLNLTTSPDIKKRQRLEHSPNLPAKPEMARSVSATSAVTRGLTPVISSAASLSPQLAPTKREVGKSALRHELVDEREEGKESWSRQKWREMAEVYKSRALLLKRHGDAYQRSPSAHQQYTSMLPHDHIMALQCLTDSVLLWLYAYFCDEQGSGRVRGGPYNESQPLRTFVLKLWETEMRKGEDESRRQMARAMVGLMHLIEAVVGYHLSAEQLSHLSMRGRELASTSTPTIHGPSPGSTTSNSPPNTAGLASTSSQPQPHPSPAGRSQSSSSSHHSPDSHTSSYNLPPDLLPLISTSTSASFRASQQLLTSRHHLSLSLLRSVFPNTFEHAINSELSDEALPAPGDHLGAARRVDVDKPERFAWPIELGMCAPVAHTVAFGRCLIEEMAEKEGKEWTRRLES